MKANGHFVFEKNVKFVDAIYVHYVLSADTKEQLGVQLLFQVIQGLGDGYGFTHTKKRPNHTIFREEVAYICRLDKFNLNYSSPLNL